MSSSKCRESPSSRATVFIDNSNLFITFMSAVAKKNHFKEGVQDTTARINYVKLLEKACNKKQFEMIRCRLYASKPPELSHLWAELKKELGSEVFEDIVFERRKKNSGEKEVDTTLVADAVELITTYKGKEKDKNIILFSGDRDIIGPIKTKAEKYGWKLHVWAFSTSVTSLDEKNIASELIDEDDTFFEEVTFTEYMWKDEIPKQRSAYLIFNKQLESLENYKTKDKFARKVVSIAREYLNLPVQVQFVLGKHTTLALIITCPEETGNQHCKDCGQVKSSRVYYNFEEDVMKVLKGRKFWPKIIQTFMSKENTGHSKSWDLVKIQSAEELEDELRVTSSERDSINQRPEPESGYTLPRRQRCRYGFHCYGITGNGQCPFYHTQEENGYFKEHPYKNHRDYKTAWCEDKKCKYISETFKCHYLHYAQESYCSKCKKSGHVNENCNSS